MLAILGLGLLLGLKHATEVDHVVAVSTLVSEHRKLRRAVMVGILWGVGHTATILVVGVGVLALRLTIPAALAGWLEFVVGLMLIGLGLSAVQMALRRRSDVHRHEHMHDGTTHIHLHFHNQDNQHREPVKAHSHEVPKLGIKPLFVGAVHGLAGSATLVLLVLTPINSAILGLLYLAIFGVGTIVGMLVMSGLIGLPFALTNSRLTRVHAALHASAGAFSILFGIWYAYEAGVSSELWRTLL